MAFLLVQCMPPTPDPILTEIKQNLEDPLLLKITSFQDYQLTDSLLPFFSHKDPTYRYAAVKAFGSIQDKTVLDSLAILLNDPLEKIRMAAAHAIGQQRDLRGEQFLIGAFEQLDSLGKYKNANGAILEAVGRCASRDFLTALSSISTYSPTDTALLTGQARGIYRYALRNIIIPEGTSKQLTFVNNLTYPPSVRLIAANYLARAKGIEISDNVEALAQTFETDKDPKIRMALALALGKINQPRASQVLLSALNSEKDYRVKCNIIRALKNFEYDAVKPDILLALEDENLHVAQTAAAFFVSNGVPQEANSYRKKAKELENNSVQGLLYEAANRHLPNYMTNTRNAINYELRNKYEASTNPYERTQLLKALAEYGWNYKYIQKQLPVVQTTMEKTGIIEALSKITNDVDFYKIFGGSFTNVSKEIGVQYIQAIKSGDIGMIAIAAGALKNENIDFKTLLLDSLPVMETALKNLPLPASIETYNALEKTIAHFKGQKEGPPSRVATNHLIDTTLLATLSTAPNATIKTNKGNIILQLSPLDAPGSVLNFIQLATKDFYNNIKFHRVVPNFVIQGGCPRGDGFGGLDYTIRSELPISHYDQEGYIGMASAGRHTEGTQFFITHSPTPHLDGNYTIFGKVTNGMDVVHNIMVGDSIQNVTIKY